MAISDINLIELLLDCGKDFYEFFKYLFKSKKIPDLDVDIDRGTIKITNFTNKMLKKIVVLEQIYSNDDLIEEYELENPYCLLTEGTLRSGLDKTIDLYNRSLLDKVVPDYLINNKINKIIDSLKDKDIREQADILSNYCAQGVDVLNRERDNCPYSQTELRNMLNDNLKVLMQESLKVEKVSVMFGDDEKSYVKTYKICPNLEGKMISENIIKNDYDFQKYEKQYNKIIGQ